MADIKPKSPRKRRARARHMKRQSQSKATKQIQSNIILPADPEPPQIFRKTKPQLNPDYIREEQEIKTSLERFSTDGQENRLDDQDLEVLFFVDSIPDIFYDAQEELEEDTQPDSVTHEKSPSIQTISNIQDSPIHLASSFVQLDENKVIEQYKLKKVTFDDENMLFIPSKKPTDSRAVLEEVTVHSDAGSTSVVRIPVKPSLDKANKYRMINRLAEEEQEEWFDASGDLVNLQNFITEPMPMSKTPKQLPMERTIKILIGKLRFENHPSFDEIVRMRLKLEQYYRQYFMNRKLKVIPVLQQKLDDLRQVNQQTEQEDVSFKMQRRELRKLIYKEAKADRLLEKQIVDIWKDLKDKKSDQGYQMTITSEEIDQQEDDARLNQRYIMELEETLEEEQELYIKEKQDYKSYLRDLEQNIDEGEIMAVQKPKKPDIARLKQEFTKSFYESFRVTGEPTINLVLQKDPSGSYESNLKNGLCYKIKFFIDEKHVASTKSRQFQNDYLVDFNTSFSVKLTTKIPETMKIELYEKNRLKIKLKIAEIFVPLPDSSEMFEDIDYIHYEFSSGKHFRASEYRNGKVELKVGWLEQGGPTFPNTSKRRNIPRRVQLSNDLIQKWFDEQALSPDDSDAEIFMKALNKGSREQDLDNENDHLQEDMDEPFVFNEDLLAFCSEEEINGNERLNMLSQRFYSNLKYKNIKFIPQVEREVEIPDETKIIDETLGTDPIDLQRHRGKKYLKKVYDTITNHCSVINQDKIDDNLLIGDQIPTVGSLSLALFEIFGPRRPLKPSRRSPMSRTSIRVTDVNQFKVVVTVVRAFGIPSRSDDHQLSSAGRRNSNMSSTRFSMRASNVRPYITVSIKDKVLRTSTADGTNPTWNEQLAVPLDADSDQIRRFLSIDLYDEFIEDLLEDDRARSSDIYQRISNRWLGLLRIPISTIYLNQRIEGTFEIKTPPILFGYTRSDNDTPEYTSMLNGTGLPDMRDLTHISLFINLEPNVDIPKFDTNELECIELEQTKIRICLWFEEYRNEFPKRAKLPLVTLLSGKRVCVTRLLGPVNIPFAIDENVERMIRRYVSLIPVYYNTDACSQLEGVWLTNREIINIMCASPKDLGVLLTCFYMMLEYDVYLILGQSLLTGDSTFALVREGSDYFIIDPISGRKYNSTDTYCPLIRIYYIVNQDNLWGNIQKENRVFLTQLDVTKSAYWRPLFNRSHDAPIGCIHDGHFMYKNSLNVRDLQMTIERKIKKKIVVWRTHRKTIWNRYIGERLKYALTGLEVDISMDTNAERNLEMLSKLFASYRINGFPINLPYTNLSTIIAQVKSTGIHLNSDNKTEFALGVYVKDYPSNIYSVWIFLVSLVPKI